MHCKWGWEHPAKYNLHNDFPDKKHKYLYRLNTKLTPGQRTNNPGLELFVMIMVSVRIQVLGVGAGCLDKDLFQQERQ